MKTIFLLALLLLSSSVAVSAQRKPLKPVEVEVELPEINVIKTITLSPCYGCRTQEEFNRGYEQTALFLTNQTKLRNSPALLFNGSLGGKDWFDVSMAGTEMSLIADLGAGFELANLTAAQFQHGVILPGESRATPLQYRVEAPVSVGHTYAVVINKGDYRGLLYFTVTAYQPNVLVELRYALKHYEALKLTGRSPGFDWMAISTQQ